MKKTDIVLLVLSLTLLIFVVFILGYVSETKILRNELEEKTAELTEVLESQKNLEDDYNNLSKENDLVNKEKKLLTEEKALINKEKEDLESASGYLRQRITSYEKFYLDSQDLLKTQVEIITNWGSDDFLKIHTVDAHDYSFYINYYIPIINTEEMLLDNLKLIASNLSKNNFGGLPLEVIGIENDNILLVNVYEPSDGEVRWISRYFQGSCGGYVTTATLVESFLQRDSKLNSWIEGVRFTYNGESYFVGDHIEGLFENIYYRNEDVFTRDEE